MRRTFTPWEQLAFAEDAIRMRSAGKRLARLGGRGVPTYPSRLAASTKTMLMIVLILTLTLWFGGWWYVLVFGVFAFLLVVFSPFRWPLMSVVFARARTRVLHEAPAHEATSMHAVLEARRKWWHGALHGPDGGKLRRQLRHAYTGHTESVVVVTAAVASCAVQTLLDSHSTPVAQRATMLLGWNVIFMVSMLTLLTWSYAVASRRTTRMLRALTRNTCVACGYDLSQLPAHNDPPGRVLRGPERCPECACEWPLVPPAVPVQDA